VRSVREEAAHALLRFRGGGQSPLQTIHHSVEGAAQPPDLVRRLSQVGALLQIAGRNCFRRASDPIEGTEGAVNDRQSHEKGDEEGDDSAQPEDDTRLAYSIIGRGHRTAKDCVSKGIARWTKGNGHQGQVA